MIVGLGNPTSPEKLMNMRALLLAFGVIAALGASARADSTFLLTIDDSNLSAVVITATGFASETDDSSTSTYDGVNLLQFFTADVTSAAKGALVGDLASMSSLGPSFSYYRWDADHASGSYVDLNLYGRSAVTETQEFSTNWAAFTGSVTIDFSAYATALPALGTHGDILAGWSGNEGQVIGSWVVVPEPSPVGLFLLGLAGLAVWRRAPKGSNSLSKDLSQP